MSEKPVALRLAEDLYAFHAAKKEMPSVGGQMLGLERYRIVASGEAFSQIRDAAAELHRQHAEIERLREALKLALNSHGRMLMSDPPQDAWKFHRVDEVIAAALRREETT